MRSWPRGSLCTVNGTEEERFWCQIQCVGRTVFSGSSLDCTQPLPPNIYRQYFGFHFWKGFDEDLYEKIKDGLLGRAKE